MENLPFVLYAWQISIKITIEFGDCYSNCHVWLPEGTSVFCVLGDFVSKTCSIYHHISLPCAIGSTQNRQILAYYTILYILYIYIYTMVNMDLKIVFFHYTNICFLDLHVFSLSISMDLHFDLYLARAKARLRWAVHQRWKIPWFNRWKWSVDCPLICTFAGGFFDGVYWR